MSSGPDGGTPRVGSRISLSDTVAHVLRVIGMGNVPLGSIVVVLFALVFFLPASAAYSPAAESQYTVGLNLIESGNYSEAVKAFDTALAEEPSYYEAWNARADALNRNRNYAEALDSSNRSLALNPSSVQGWINRGYILYNLGRYGEELAAYDTAIALDPKNATAWFNRGYALAAQGHYDEALSAFDTVKSLDPDYPYLEGNRKTVQEYKDATTPFYIRYAGWILVFAGAIVVVAVWLYGLKKRRR